MQFDILGIGNAIVDVIAPAEPVFLDKQNMRPGSMTLIDAERAEALTAIMPRGQESSGGSVANSCAVAARLGARVAFLGKVADDSLGAAFAHDLAAAEVHFPTPALQGQAPTARCLILVTPDGQRTMHTYLGACTQFDSADLDPTLIAAAKVTYLEGYLFDPPSAQAAFHQAAEHARSAGRQVALSLSDAFCVDRHRGALLALLPRIDILFANEVEICSLYECDSFEEAASRAASDVELAVLTRSELGSLIFNHGQILMVAAVPAEVVDTTGAGDCYAAGFLAAYTQGGSLADCGALASRAASACISVYGARPAPSVLAALRHTKR